VQPLQVRGVAIARRRAPGRRAVSLFAGARRQGRVQAAALLLQVWQAPLLQPEWLLLLLLLLLRLLQELQLRSDRACRRRA
jgi:hypothetical protein